MTVSGGLAAPADVVEAGLRAANRGDCVVIVEDTSEAEVRFAVNTTTTNGVRRARRVTVVSVAEVAGGFAAGVATRSGVVDIADLVRAAELEAAAATVADDASPLLGGVVDDAFGDGPAETDLSVLGGFLSQMSDVFERAERASTVLAGFASHSVSSTYVGTSAGLRRRHEAPTGAAQMVARSSDGANSAWVGAGTKDFSDITSESLEDELVQRLGWATRRVEVQAGRHPVVLPPPAVADFMLFLAVSAGGQDAEDGQTVFSKPGGGTRVGERLCPLPFELRSDPNEPGIESSPFLAVTASSARASVFDNGLALGPTSWVNDGCLGHLQYHRAGAAKRGIEVAPLGGNLVLELAGAQGTTADLVTRTERGLLVTCLWYIRIVDPATLLLTGLTRDGVYLIEDGEVTGAVTNFRFNESPVDLLARASDVGATVRTLGREFGDSFSRTAMPALRIDDFNMSSVSPAS